MKRLMSLLLAVVMTIGVCGTAFAGQWTEDLHGRYYTNDDGSYPTNKWQWIDDDGDGIAQCYYFDNSGYSVRNGKTPDGYETNMEGQWVIDGVVQQENAADVPVNGAQISATAAYTGTPIVVLGEYMYQDSSGHNTYHYYIIQNTGLETLNVTVSSVAYSSDGRMVATDDGYTDAVGAGCISIVESLFVTDEKIEYLVSTWSAKNNSRYQSVLQYLTYEQSSINNGAIFQVTNNGPITARFVKGYALFFSGNKLVNCRSAYFGDSDSVLEPGQTSTKQFNCYENFDSIKFYLQGESK